jgi:Domain of unknown function (DUF6265)
MRKKIVLAIVGIIVLGSWISLPEKSIQKAEWLIGTWENKTQRGSIYETWTKISDDELHGKSYILKNNDTVVFETVQLLQEGDKLFYIPTVKNQNNNLPVRFALTRSSDTELVFELPEHDFPQVIAYTKIHTDSLVAQISGKKNGQERRQTFPMKRVK